MPKRQTREGDALPADDEQFDAWVETEEKRAEGAHSSQHPLELDPEKERQKGSPGMTHAVLPQGERAPRNREDWRPATGLAREERKWPAGDVESSEES